MPFFEFLPERYGAHPNEDPNFAWSERSTVGLDWKLWYDDPSNSPGSALDGVGDVVSQFKMGEDEGRDYLNLAGSSIDHRGWQGDAAAGRGQDRESQDPDNPMRRTKQDLDYAAGRGEERRCKGVACSPGEEDIWELIDKLLEEEEEYDEEENRGRRQDEDISAAAGKGRIRGKRKKRVVDLWSLLGECARAVAGFERQTAESSLSTIREHCSAAGDSMQRLAHYLAEGLEARLCNSASETYSAFSFNSEPVGVIVKMHRLLAATPIVNIPVRFCNQNILKHAEQTTTLHIIDFGIRHGLQWPALIKHLARRPGGTPKLRVTGIELPGLGFQPGRSTAETGCRLAKLCSRFGLKFAYNLIVCARWEIIKVEDLLLRKDETVAVSCFFRLQTLLDESAVEKDNPRDAILKLIRVIRPRIFVCTEWNGSHNSPYFLSRFREIMHHFFSVFDMLDAVLVGADAAEKMAFEKEFLGRRMMNMIACEGWMRIQRPEKYQEWERRMLAAGLRAMPLDQHLTARLERAMKCRYHPDFGMEKSGSWLRLDWRGRTMVAMSCWFGAR